MSPSPPVPALLRDHAARTGHPPYAGAGADGDLRCTTCGEAVAVQGACCLQRGERDE